MDIKQFSIGIEFFCCGKKYQCTDIGTRTITAICLSDMQDDSWKSGPPYGVEEISFDEEDIKGCNISKDGYVTIDIDIPDDVFLACALLAHEQNVTLNEFIVRCLETHLESQSKTTKLINDFHVYDAGKNKRLTNRGEPWDHEQDTQLIKNFEDGLDIYQIADIHKRSNGAIKSRLAKLKIHHTLTELNALKPHLLTVYGKVLESGCDVTLENLGRQFGLTETEVRLILGYNY